MKEDTYCINCKHVKKSWIFQWTCKARKFTHHMTGFKLRRISVEM